MRAVQPSASKRTPGLPAFTIGSIASTMPGRNRGPRPGCGYCAAGTCKPNLEPDCGRFNEVWNLVFMGEYRHEDGTRTDLPKKNIDTGSGFERLAIQLQGKDTVYDTDIFAPIIERIDRAVHKWRGSVGDFGAKSIEVSTIEEG